MLNLHHACGQDSTGAEDDLGCIGGPHHGFNVSGPGRGKEMGWDIIWKRHIAFDATFKAKREGDQAEVSRLTDEVLRLSQELEQLRPGGSYERIAGEDLGEEPFWYTPPKLDEEVHYIPWTKTRNGYSGWTNTSVIQMPFAGQWLKNGSFFVRRNSVILELGSDPTHSKAHNHGNFPRIGILSSPTRLLGRR